MAINPDLIEIKKVTELPDLALAITNYFAHCKPDGVLGKATLQALATFISPYVASVGASGYIAVTGTVLPNPTANPSAFTLVGAGTFTQTTGGSVVTTEALNVLSWNGTTWSLTTPVTIDMNYYFLKDEMQNYSIGGGVIKWRKVGSNWTLNVSGNPVIYFPGGGYATIQNDSRTIPSGGSFVWLSSDAAGLIPLDINQSGAITTAKAYVQSGNRTVIAGKLNYPNFPKVAHISNDDLQTLPGFNQRSSEIEITDGWQVFQGSVGVFKVSRILASQKVNITLSGSSSLIIAPNGGYYTIDPFSLDVSVDQAVVVSTSATEYLAPRVMAGTTGAVKVFFLAISRTLFQEAVLMEKCPVVGYLSSNWSWTTKFSALYLNTDKTVRNDYQVGSREDFKIFETGTTVEITVLTDAVLFDSFGGYRLIKTGFISCANGEIVYLSSNPSSYVNPNIDTRGAGESLYLYKELYSVKTAATGNKLGSFPLGIVWKFKWNSLFDALKVNSGLSSDNQRELDYTLPTKTFDNSPIREAILPFIEKYKGRDQDVTLVQVGDSISTNLNYTTERTDQQYRPPLMTEANINSFIEEKLRWKEQSYRRFDAMTVVGGSTPVFTEILGGGTPSNISVEDATWGFTTPGINFFKPLTRCIDAGTNSGVSYVYPANMKRCNFILHSDFKFANTTVVTVAEGNGKVEAYDDVTSSWVEANGFSFINKEPNTLFTGPGGTFHRDQYQKRLKMRSLTVLTEKNITIANVGTGRFGYWGIEYSPKEYMFTYIAASKGGHDIARLRNFEPWMVDAFNPDLILQQCCIINEKAQTGVNLSNPAVVSPATFASHFSDYYDALIAKGYLILPYTLFGASQSGIVDETTGAWGVGTFAGETITIDDYIGSLTNMYDSKSATHLNFFYRFLDISYRKAEIAGTNNIFTSAIAGSGITGNTLTVDGGHLNNYGQKIAFRLLEKYFNF